MLQQETADDYILATGHTNSVREFVENAFKFIGEEIEWEGEGLKELGRSKSSGNILVDISEKFYRPAEVDLLHGDASKALDKLGWKAETGLAELTEIMMNYDLEEIAKLKQQA